MTTLERERLHQSPPPQANESGWYPDPLGSTAERFWDGEWMELTRTPRLRIPAETLAREEAPESPPPSLLSRFPSLQQLPLLAKKRGQRNLEREHLKQRLWVEAERQAFFQSPAGRARLAFERGLHLFQYELEIDRVEPTVIPGPVGAEPRLTEDAVDILNSVVVEGWKLVDGKFFYVEPRGVVGCYLFKRSTKRRRQMNNPWQRPLGPGTAAAAPGIL
ncbi:MAG TPA: DUF2510 domain-containing protein [Solirubrobacterales bacterium]|jgi:hypothetical protein|nr:DUF2510 domain-containing protein [Solirubrobacterales bacterium]HWT90462.1 DUF2510 domain-containing protein [Solirubrobacterales bacterium]